MPDLETYKSTLRTILLHYNSVVPVIKKACEVDKNNSHRIIGNFIGSLVNRVTRLINIALSDPDLNERDIEELHMYVGQEVRNFVRKNFGKMGMLLLERLYTDSIEKIERCGKELQKQIQEFERSRPR